MYFILTLFVMGSFSPFFPSGFAQEYNSSEITLFIPEKMIAGESYRGMITLLTPPSKDSLVLLSTSNLNL